MAADKYTEDVERAAELGGLLEDRIRLVFPGKGLREVGYEIAEVLGMGGESSYKYVRELVAGETVQQISSGRSNSAQTGKHLRRLATLYETVLGIENVKTGPVGRILELTRKINLRFVYPPAHELPEGTTCDVRVQFSDPKYGLTDPQEDALSRMAMAYAAINRD